MIPDLDTYRSANLLVKQYGGQPHQDTAAHPTYNDFPMLLSFSTNHFGRMPSSYCLP